MATYTQTATTTANTVYTVTFTQWLGNIEVVNLGGDNLWIRTDGTNPTIGGTNSIVIPASTWKLGITNDKLGSNNTEVRLISSTPVTFTVGAQ